MNALSDPAVVSAMRRPIRRSLAPRSGGRSRLRLRDFASPKVAVLSLLLLTYVWRFHDLNSMISSLRLAGVATVSSWVLLAISPRLGLKRRTFGFAIAWIVIAWIGFMGLTAPFGLVPQKSWTDWTGVQLKTLTMFLFIVASVRTCRGVKQVMAANLCGAAVLTIFYAKGGFALWGSPVSMYDVNDLALHLNMTIPFALFFTMSSRSRSVRALLWALIFLMALAILMTQSRGGFLTLGVLTFLFVVRVKGPVWIRLLPAVLLVLGVPLLPDATKARLMTLFEPTADYNYSDEEGRIEIWKRGVGYMMRRPITGMGLGNFATAERLFAPQAQEQVDWRGKVAHNVFVQVAVELGIPGLLLFVAAIGTSLVGMLHLARRMSRRSKDPRAAEFGQMASYLALSLIAFCVGGFFLSMAYAPMLFVLFGMSIALDGAARRWQDAIASSGQDVGPVTS